MLFFSAAGILLLNSCQKEDSMVIFEGHENDVTLAVNNSAVELMKDQAASNALRFSWNNPNYTFNTGLSSHNVSYTLDLDTNASFSSPVSASVMSDLGHEFTNRELNNLLTTLGLVPGVAQDVYARVRASLGPEVSQVVSNTVSFNATTYSDISITYLWVPGDYQGWNHATSPLLWSTNGVNYEGYVYVPGGGSREFKFSATNGWGGTNYGDGGGTISTAGDAPILKFPDNAEGQMYLLKVNLNNLTYTATETDWGIIGAATPGGWDNSTPMEWDAAAGVLKVTLDMGADAYKFRANNAWDINLGASPAGPEYLDYGGGDLVNAEPGTKTVILDLRAPAVNTPPKPFKYKFSIQ